MTRMRLPHHHRFGEFIVVAILSTAWASAISSGFAVKDAVALVSANGPATTHAQSLTQGAHGQALANFPSNKAV